MVGRGARPSDIIFKDQFIVTDLGGNVDRFNQWSSDRDWTRLFKYGLNSAKKAKETLIQCDSCGFNWMGTSLDPCAECGNYNKAVKSTSNSVLNTEDYLHKSTELINKIVMPNAVKIREFVERTNGGKPEYWNIIIDRYIDLWKFNGDKQTYLNRIKTKTLEPKIQEYIKNYYFQSNKLIGKYRTNSYLSNRTKLKLDKLYDNI
jgi:ribosomal protein L37E